MPRASTKKPKKAAAARAEEQPPESAAAVAVEEAPETPSDALQPPTEPVEPSETEKAEARTSSRKDHIAASLNIAKLQAMSMTELNNMARELSVENFGTMRKHEVIFHILQKNAERAGVLFSEGVLEVLPEGFGFLRSQSFN